MNEDEMKLREYLIILNEEHPTHKRENANFSIINLFEKQQKEIKARLKEIDSLYKMMSTKDDEIKYLEQKLEQYGLDYQILKDDIEEHRIAYVDTPEFEEKYISKDKIKELIKEKAIFKTIAVKDIEELLVSGQESDQEGGQEDE